MGLLCWVDDDFADVLAIQHHFDGAVDLAEGEAVGDHAVKAHGLPVVLKEADALLKVLLRVQAVADEGDLLEGDLADDELVGVPGETEGEHLAAAAAEIRHLENAGGGPGGVIDDVESAAARDLAHEIHRVGLRGVDRLNAHGLDKLTARLIDLGDDDAARTPGLGKDGDVEADGRAAGDKDGIARLDLAANHDVIADGKGLAKDGDIIGDVLIKGDKLVHADLGVLGEAAVRVDAEELEVLADMGEAALAGGALAAGDDRVHEHALADLEGAGIPGGQGLDGAENLMAENGGDGGGHVLAAVDGDIGTADAGKLDLDERLVVIRNGDGDIGKLEVKPVFQYSCSHSIAPPSITAACRCRRGCRRRHTECGR